MNIRNETVADVPVIEAVTNAAFLNAPHTSHTEQFIVNALRRAGSSPFHSWRKSKGV
jgi:putative acetyltransferase